MYHPALNDRNSGRESWSRGKEQTPQETSHS